MVQACDPLPVTAKIRIGWDERSVNAVTTARLLEGAGIRRIAVHGRTRAQGYSGYADWDVIAAVAAAVRVPVIGNGDITDASTALRRLGSGVSGLMIGRAAMANPWIFTEVKHAFEGKPFVAPTLMERWALVLRHCREEVGVRGETHGMHGMRGRLMAYTRGMPGARPLRASLSKVATLTQLEEIIGGHLDSLGSIDPFDTVHGGEPEEASFASIEKRS
jgi:tRNA-dihydrouridine synthase